MTKFLYGTTREALISVSELEKEQLCETTIKQVKKEELTQTDAFQKKEEFINETSFKELAVADLQGQLVKAQLIIDYVRACGSDPLTLVKGMTYLLLQAKK